MAVLSDIVKRSVPVIGPTIGFVNAAIRLGTTTTSGPIECVLVAVSVVAEECTPPSVYYSGKCITALGCYVGGALTMNPVWFGAGTQILTSIIN